MKTERRNPSSVNEVANGIKEAFQPFLQLYRESFLNDENNKRKMLRQNNKLLGFKE